MSEKTKKYERKDIPKKSQYIVISEYIYKQEDLSDSEKITFSLIDSLSPTKVSTSYIAKTLNMSVSAINMCLQRLEINGYISWKYYFAKKREFKSEVSKNKTKKDFALLTTEILNKDISSTYKITAGVIAGSSRGSENFLGGYNFNNVKRLSKLINLSVSSTYRHIVELVKVGLVKKDKESSWLLRPQDSHSLHYARLQQSKRRDMIRQGKVIVEEEPPVIITPEQDEMLNRIYEGR